MALHLGNGRQLVEFDYGPQQPSEVRSRTIKRAELYGALRNEAIRRGASIEYGKRLDTVGQLGSGQVEARFTDGSAVLGDLLIGADGLGSFSGIRLCDLRTSAA
jgi:2-polyprenyl-6-methoxyphenol hydroxylase-like FAD-dependent oxidoreductase